MPFRQGYEADASDDEWDAHVTWYYGAQSTVDRGVGNGEEPLDRGMDVQRMLIESLDLADCIHRDANQARQDAEDRTNNPRTPTADPVHEQNCDGPLGNDEPPLHFDGSPAAADRGRGENPTSPVFPDAVLMEVDEADVGRGDVPPGREGGEYADFVEDDDLNWGENENDDDAAVAALEEAAATPLYRGSEHSSMGATYLLLSSGKLHNCSNTYLDELFRTLSMTILPQPNSLPRSYQEASEYLKRLGHSFKTIDVCPNNCVLYRKDLQEARHCPKCRAPRKKRSGRSEVPQKVARYFPVIPRLKRMFRSLEQAIAMTWWALQQFDGPTMRHVSQSKQWEFINNRFRHEFGMEDRNVRLGLVADGINPSGDKRSVYSLWPVLLLNYNIPPWLSTKKYFMMLAILIPGPRSVTGEQFDVFLDPLIDELLELWHHGVYCRDVSNYKRSSHFVMRAMVIWTVGDYPAYGMMAGTVTKGFVGCTVCGEGFRSRRSKVLHKNVFCNCARRWLPDRHPLREDTTNFEGPEHRAAPPPITGFQVKAAGEERMRWLAAENRRPEDDPVQSTGIKRVSALFRLPYWEVTYMKLCSLL